MHILGENIRIDFDKKLNLLKLCKLLGGRKTSYNIFENFFVKY